MKLFHREMGEGTPLIIMHGLFGASDNWMTLSRKLAEDYHVYLLDLRNHGRTDNVDDFSYELMSEDLHEFITDHQIEQPIIVGHSMGGKVAMFFALQYPTLFSKLVVVDMAVRAYPVHHQSILDGLNAIPLHTIKSRREADEILAQHEPTLGVRQFLLKNLYRTDNGFDWRFNLSVLTEKITSLGDAVPTGSANSKPSLFIRGLQSKYVLDTDWSMIQDLFPQAQLADIAEAGHWVHAEKPMEFFNALTQFIAE